jgi:TonB family protein
MQLILPAVILLLAGTGTSGATEVLRVSLPGPRVGLASLRAGLASAEPEARARAAWELAGASDVPADLREALRAAASGDPEERVRASAAWALGHLGPDERPFDEPPRALAVPAPRYPDWALQSRITGTVLVEILIDERGAVAHAEIRQSIPALDAAALRSVKRWSFEPALKDGRPIAAYAEAPVTFAIH